MILLFFLVLIDGHPCQPPPDYARALEELKTMPSGAVWDYYCLMKNVPPAAAWIQDVLTYEESTLKERE